jgi:hypothetical protein
VNVSAVFDRDISSSPEIAFRPITFSSKSFKNSENKKDYKFSPISQGKYSDFPPL